MAARSDLRSNLAQLALAMGCAACGDLRSAPPPQVVAISISPGPTIDINLGTTHPLAVLELNAAGQLVAIASPASVRFTSRDTTRVLVDMTGMLTAVGTGTSYVVAAWDSPRTLVDSVRVDVASSR
jgi:hypothetical protein